MWTGYISTIPAKICMKKWIYHHETSVIPIDKTRLRKLGEISSMIMFEKEDSMDLHEEDCETLLEVQRSIEKHHTPCQIIVPWLLAVFFLCTTCILFIQDKNVRIWKLGTYEHGFVTDFVATSPELPIKIIKKQFTNDLLSNFTTQTLYNQPLDRNEATYIGTPSPAINEAWHKLLHAQYIPLTSPEAQQIRSERRTTIWYNGEHNFMELSVFHNLHCLNEIRLALDDRDENEEAGEEDWMHKGRVHLDHCVDQIRQALMCHADLTPVPMVPVEGGPEGAIIGNGEMHTCRDFDAIWEWVEARSMKQRAYGD